MHNLDKGLNSAETLDTMSSMKNVGTAIKGIAEALKSDKTFVGALADLDVAGFDDLDKRIQAMNTSGDRLKR